MTEHLRLNGVYWGLTALHLLGHPEALPRQQTVDFVLACQNLDGGFGAAPGHDSHMLYTVSAIQILATVDALSSLDQSGGKEKVGHCECTFLAAYPGTNRVQGLQAGKCQVARLLAMNGARLIRDFSSVPLLHCQS